MNAESDFPAISERTRPEGPMIALHALIAFVLLFPALLAAQVGWSIVEWPFLGHFPQYPPAIASLLTTLAYPVFYLWRVLSGRSSSRFRLVHYVVVLLGGPIGVLWVWAASHC
jgi:hypothetical protein